MSIVSRIAHSKSTGIAHHRSRWWNELPLDFHARTEVFDLALRDRVQVGMTAIGDIFTRTMAAAMVGATALPLGFTRGRLKTLEAEGEFYGGFADRRAREEFFTPPESRHTIVRSKALTPHFPPTRGRCEDLRFESTYRPKLGGFAQEHADNTRNQTAHARHWFHDDGPRPTIVAIHGFSADFYRLNEWFFALPLLYELGCDVLLFTLPHHGPRRGTRSPFSGHGFFSGGISGINEAMGQAVHDFRVFFEHLQHDRGVKTIGVTGVSLGGYASALLAGVEPRLAFAIPNVPLISIIDLALEWRPAGDMVRALMLMNGLTLPQLRRYLAVSSPLTYAPMLRKEHLFIIGGVGDRLASPQHSHELWEHWDRPDIYWFPGSHFLHFDRGRYLQEIAKFLGSLVITPKK